MRQQTQLVVAGAIVIDDQGQVLLTQRSQPELPEAHGRWEMPAGKVEHGESPHETAVREVFEETGFQVEADLFKVSVKDMVWHFPERDAHTILIAYRCRLIGGQKKVQGGKVADVRWWPIDRLPLNNILPLDDEFIFELADRQDLKEKVYGLK